MKPLPAFASLSRDRLSLHLAGWLLDSSRLGRSQTVQGLAGRLLKRPARRGLVEAQRRLGLLLCLHCGGQRDRRIGQELLRQAARSGDPRARQALTNAS